MTIEMVPHNVNSSAIPLICIVDDDASMADSTRFLLRSFGLRAEAFLSAQELQDSGLVQEARCLILDLRMPGIDGLELQRNLASTNRRVPIIFVSAPANDDEWTEHIKGGAVDFLRKPFSEEALFNAIQLALSQHH